MQRRSKHHPIVWARRNRSKLIFIYLWCVFIGPIEYFKAKAAVVRYISTSRHICRNKTMMSTVHEPYAEGKQVTCVMTSEEPVFCMEIARGWGHFPLFFSRIQFWSSQICWEQIWLPKDGLDSASLAAAIEGGPQECVRQLAAGLHGGGSIFPPPGNDQHLLWKRGHFATMVYFSLLGHGHGDFP